MALPTLYVYPFTQVVDDCMKDSRESSGEDGVRSKYRSRVNQFYMRDLPMFGEHKFWRRIGSITLTTEYKTGTVAISAGGTTVTGTSTVWTSAMTGRKFTVSGNDEVYDFTYVSATSGTISPAFTGSAAVTGKSYSIFQDVYDLASDFLRITDEPGFYYHSSNGAYQMVRQVDDILWRSNYTATTSDFANYWREYPNRTAAGLQQVWITPPPASTSRILRYEYIKALAELHEVTTGTATTAAASTSVTTSTDISARINTNMYFRSNPDGTWVRITAVSGTTLTLASAYPTTNTAKNYAVSDVPDMPNEMQGILRQGGNFLTAMEQESAMLGTHFGRLSNQIQQLFGIEARKRFGRQYFKRLDRLDRWTPR